MHSSGGSRILGIDIGTSGCKVSSLSESGELVETVSREWFPATSPDGMSEQDPREWVDGVAAAIDDLRRSGSVDVDDIAAIGVTGQMQGATLVDGDGAPTRPSILWNDTRSSAQSRRILAAAGERIESVIGGRFSDGLTLGKLLWVRENDPEAWARTRSVLHASGYIALTLTGRRLSDVNNLGQSGMNDAATGSWSPWILDLFDIPPGMLPDVVGCTEVPATTDAGARALGLRPGIPVVYAGGDSGAESFSLGLAGAPRLKVRLGTAADLNLVTPFAPGGRGFPDVVPGYVIRGAYTKSCASSVRWARGLFFPDQEQSSATYALMDREAAAVPVGAEGLRYHPYLAGEADPYFNSAMSGMLHGLRSGMGRGHVVRAVYEGIAMSIRDVIEHTPGFAEASEVAFVGGGAKSSVMLQSLVDVMGRDGVVARDSDASYGAALLAGHAIAAWDGFALARENVATGRRIVHDPARAAQLSRLYARYRVEAGQEDAATRG